MERMIELQPGGREAPVDIVVTVNATKGLDDRATAVIRRREVIGDVERSSEPCTRAPRATLARTNRFKAAANGLLRPCPAGVGPQFNGTGFGGDRGTGGPSFHAIEVHQVGEPLCAPGEDATSAIARQVGPDIRKVVASQVRRGVA
jgi:hypothetical protein